MKRRDSKKGNETSALDNVWTCRRRHATFVHWDFNADASTPTPKNIMEYVVNMKIRNVLCIEERRDISEERREIATRLTRNTQVGLAISRILVTFYTYYLNIREIIEANNLLLIL